MPDVAPIASITGSITESVVAHGVVAVFVLMAVDALLPVGGELIMVVAGAIAAGALGGAPGLLGHQLVPGAETYVVLALSGVLGSLVGAWAGWLIGDRAGRDTLERHGHLVHVSQERLARAERWFARHGARAVLLGRLTPLVRSFISIPAGLFADPIGRYTALTALASVVWCFGFAGLGWALGSSYGSIDRATHVFEAALVVGAVIVLAAFLVRRRARNAAAAVACTSMRSAASGASGTRRAALSEGEAPRIVASEDR
jgi:membrane protein DedA with SNARE-associated domain